MRAPRVLRPSTTSDSAVQSPFFYGGGGGSVQSSSYDGEYMQSNHLDNNRNNSSNNNSGFEIEDQRPLLPLAQFRQSRMSRLSGIPRPEAYLQETATPRAPNIFFHKEDRLMTPRKPPTPRRPFVPVNPFEARRKFTSFVQPLNGFTKEQYKNLENYERGIRQAKVLQPKPFVPVNGSEAKKISTFVSLDTKHDKDFSSEFIWRKLSSRQRTRLQLADIGSPDASPHDVYRAKIIASQAIEFDRSTYLSKSLTAR